MSLSTLKSKPEAIAILGMSGRFPGAASVEQFWLNLRDGVESISHLTSCQLLSSGINPALLDNPDYVAARAILDDVSLFDAAFFGYTPRDAEITDPQHRVFLEICWEALEHAGYDAERYPGSIGVFAGSSMNTYLLSNLMRDREALQEFASAYQVGGYNTLIGNDKDYLATRVSYKLNLKGPSVAVQSACSTSLVAVCQAIDSLRAGRCDMALAGAVSISFPQERGYIYQEGGMASPDGHCRAFDADSAGTVFGSGAGVVALKRLSDAVSDGDTVQAVILGAGINNDGSQKVSYLAPSVTGQAGAIEAALRDAGVGAESISYVEAHGTGTPLGDPIEVAGLEQAFRSSGAKRSQYCGIGSAKTNIGHLAEAAGVTGLIKTVLALQHNQIPPTLHYHGPNPRIDFAASPFYVVNRLSEWQSQNEPRRAGVSSFGVGGTNAHVVLEEAHANLAASPGRPCQLLVLSAKTPTALTAACNRLADHLTSQPSNLADVAFTLQVGRKEFAYRRSIAARTADEAAAKLRTVSPEPAKSEGGRRFAFMFPGQGSQKVDMCRELYEIEPTFRADVDACCHILAPLLGLDLRTALFPPHETRDESAAKLSETWLTQPAIFTIEYALAMLWIEWGVLPDAMIGHSIGEYVAATLAGVFSLSDALKIVAKRAALMQAQPSGSMLAVRLPVHDLTGFLDGGVSVAAVNSPALTVLSGPHDALAAVEARLAELNKPARRLHTSHAFHSAMMDPVLEPFSRVFDGIVLNAPIVPFISNVTGTWITDAEATDPGYWVRHIRETVRFADGVNTLSSDGTMALLEVGPGNSLTMLARQATVARKNSVFSSFDHVTSEVPDTDYLVGAVGRLWELGAQIDWSKVQSGETRRRVPLPAYPFERKRYWVEPVNIYEPVKPTDPGR